jgi:hypothetical protein
MTGAVPVPPHIPSSPGQEKMYFLKRVRKIAKSDFVLRHVCRSVGMCAVPGMAVFRSALISCFPGVLLRVININAIVIFIIIFIRELVM